MPLVLILHPLSLSLTPSLSNTCMHIASHLFKHKNNFLSIAFCFPALPISSSSSLSFFAQIYFSIQLSLLPPLSSKFPVFSRFLPSTLACLFPTLTPSSLPHRLFVADRSGLSHAFTPSSLSPRSLPFSLESHSRKRDMRSEALRAFTLALTKCVFVSLSLERSAQLHFKNMKFANNSLARSPTEHRGNRRLRRRHHHHHHKLTHSFIHSLILFYSQ